MEIRIKLDVENPDEVLKAHKGGVLGFVADMVLSKQKKKYRVEKAVYEQIAAGLREELPARLDEECVKAIVKVEIVNDDLIEENGDNDSFQNPDFTY